VEKDDVERSKGPQASEGVDALPFWFDEGGFGGWRENFENVG
jgi:hypothetical protein